MMKWLKRIGSLALVMVLTLSAIMPHVGTVFASNLSDDLTGWTVGKSSTITGNATDGWEIALAGSGYDTNNGNYYTANTAVSNLQMTLDLSGVADRQNFCISFGNTAYGLQKWGDTKAFFMLKRVSSSLEFCGHTGSAEVGKTTISGFDFSKSHVFEFAKVEDIWQIAIDGTTYPMDGTDTFVKGMLAASPEKTVVGFMRSYSSNCAINNVNFTTKDLEGWTKGTDSALYGNATDGWNLSVTNNIFSGGSKYTSYYASDLGVDKLQINMDLSGLYAGSNLWLMLGNANHSPGAWSATKAGFVIKKTSDGTKLELSAHNGGKEWGKVSITDFDFTKEHTFEFVQDNGVWQPALDGKVYAMDEVDSFVKGMLASSANKTIIGFAPQCSGTNKHTIKNIKFVDKTAMKNDLTGWEKDTNSTITGNPTDGWKLSTSGNVFAGAKYGSYYSTNIGVSKLQMTFDLSELVTGKNLWLVVADAKGAPGAWSDTKASFMLKKKNDTTLEFCGHTGGALVGTSANISFDFTKQHVFNFVKNGDVWKPAIDGVVYDIDCTAFVNGMTNKSSSKTVVGFGPQGDSTYVVKNIKFEEIALQDLTGWETVENSAVTGNPTDGWKLSTSGSIFSSSKYGSYYTANIGVSNLQMTFDLSELVTGKNLWLVVADAKGAPGAWSDTKASFIMKKIDDTTLEFVGHNGGAEVGTNAKIQDFDFTKSHVLTFVKNGDMWKPAIDGIMYDVDCTAFMNGMTTKSADKTVIGFGPQSDSIYVIKNIKFEEKPVDLNDLTGWERSNYTTITGTPADGWTVSMSGSIFNGSQYGNYYSSNISASKLQMTFDFSELISGKNVWLVFSNEKATPGNWSATKASFVMKKLNDTTLEFVGHTGGALVGQTANITFDFTKVHEFTFVKDGEYWKPAIDGVIYEIDCTEFVEGMIEASPQKTVVGFGPQSDTPLVIKNVTFSERTKEIDWQHGATVTVTGDRDAGYGLTGPAFTVARYLYKLKPQDTTVSFELKKEDAQTNAIVLSEDTSMGLLPTAEEMKNARGMVFLIEQKNGETYLQYWDEGHKDKVLFLAKYKDFDFDATHTLTFTYEHGNWYAVFDGEVLRSYQLNELVENMLKAEDGVYYRFSGWQNAYTYENVSFAHTPTDISGDSHWNVVGYEMSGMGNDLSFKGNGYASWNKPVDLTETSIEAQFKPADGGWVSITVGDTPTVGATILPGLVVPESKDNAISLIFGRQNETDLRLSLYGTNKEGKKAEYLITLIKNFDFDATHEIRFVEKNGNYYLAIDGQILQWPNHDGDKKYITNALTSCLKKVEKEAYFRFLNDQALGAEWKQIKFVDESFVETDLFVDGDVTVGQNKNGLSAVGIGTMGINKKFDIKKDKLSVQFDTVEGNWIALTIGDTASPMVNFFVGIGNEHNIMTILLARQKNNILRISLLDQGEEKMFMALSHFDFDKTHTFSFVEHRGKYYLAIDDRMIEAVVADGDDEVVTKWVTKCVKALSKSGAYVRFVSPYDTMEISNVSWKGMGTIRGVKAGTVTGKSPKTGDFTPIQPLVYSMVLSTTVVVGFGVQKYRRRRKAN